MATLKAATKALLKADGTLTALVAAAQIMDSADVGREGLKTSDLKNGTTPIIQPSIYIRWTTEDPLIDTPDTTEHIRRGFCEIYFYDDSSFTTIVSARLRVYALLHKQSVAIDSGYHFRFVWGGDVTESRDAELSACMERSRYMYYLKET